MRNSHRKSTGTASGTRLSKSTLSLALLWLFVTNAGAQDDAVEFKYLEVKVVDPEGKPMTDVDVEVSIDWAAFPMPTDEDGMIGLNVPSSGAELMLSVHHEGFEVIGARWKKDEEIPDEFTIQLEKGATIGGIVHNEDGNPVEGVSVQGTIYHGQNYPGEKGEGQLRPILKGEIAVTDEEGRWQTASAPHNLVNSRFRLTLEFAHPDYVAGTRFSVDKDVYKPLQAFENIAVLKFGVDLRGRVLDPEDNPVAGAKLLLGRHRYVNKPLEAETDKNGAYHIAKAPPGSEVLTIASLDWAPELMDVELERGMKPLDVQLKPGNTIRIRVVDPEGEPIEGVSVYPREWRGYETLDDPSMRRKTDADGIWQWDHAPDDEVRYEIYKSGHQSTKEEDNTEFVPREEPYEVTMLPAVVVTGKVIDKETGQPIEKFESMEGIWWNSQYDNYVLQTGNEQAGSGGEIRHEMDSGCTKFLLKITADGYLPALSREILPEEGEVNIDFELEPGEPPSGVVKLPDGSPVVNAQVAMATPDRSLSVRDGVIRNSYNLLSTTSNAEGRFAFTQAESNYALICAQEEGWAYVERDKFEASREIVLQPWAQVSGQVMQGTQALAGEEVHLVSSPSYAPDKPRANWTSEGVTDDAGNFTIERVKAGTAAVTRLEKFAKRGEGRESSTFSHTALVEVEAGEIAHVVIGGEGRIVGGRLAIPDDYHDEISWNMGIVRFEEQTEVDGGDQAPRAYSPFDRRYAAAISPDGSYKVRDMLPGKYKMTVALYPKTLPTMGAWKPIGTLEKSVNVPASDSGEDAEVVDLGKMVLEIPDENAQE